MWEKVSAFVEIRFDECLNVNTDGKSVYLKTGETLHYQRAVFDSSPIAAAVGAENCSPVVYVANGFGRPRTQFECFYDPAWHYIASHDTPIFRIGNYEICGACKQNGKIPFYAESSSYIEQDNLSVFFEECQITSVFVVKNAYPVVEKTFAEKITEKIKADALKNHFWIGRYGKDQWFSMSDTILDTIEVIERNRENI